MACCSDNAKPFDASAVRTPGGPGRHISLPVARMGRDRAGICQSCRFQPICVNGQENDIGRKARMEPASRCWAGLWPDERGRVRRTFGWVGVPFPTRARRGLTQAWRVFTRHIAEDGEYSGCGCLQGLMWLKPFVPWGKRGWGRKLAAESSSLTAVFTKSTI